MMHGFYIEGGKKNETDLSAKEKTKKERTWFQKEKTEDERARLQKKNEH